MQELLYPLAKDDLFESKKLISKSVLSELKASLVTVSTKLVLPPPIAAGAIVIVELVLKPIPLSVIVEVATPEPFTTTETTAEAATFEPLLPIVTFVPGTAIV